MPEPFDYETEKLEYLQARQEKVAAVQQLMAGAARIAEVGAEGVQEVAATHPEVLLAAIVGLAAVVQQQNEEITDLTESWFSSLDSLKELRESMEAMAARYGLTI